MMSLNKTIFQNPPCEYRGVTLWMLNDDLELKEIDRQLRGFHSAGWGAVITRTFVGLRTPYLSDKWMALTKAIIKLSKELGIKVWLQAGYMPSGFPGLEEKFKHEVVVRKTKDESCGAGEKLLYEGGDFAYYSRKLDYIIDLLNPEATGSYLEKAYEVPWYNRFKGEFGKTVEAVWVDEPSFSTPLLPWSEKLPTSFEQKWGYSLIGNLPSLFSDVGDFQSVRHHYWRTVTQMFVTGYTEQVGMWCAKNKVRFSGHLMGEDTLNSQIGSTAATMPHYEFMQLPGIDHLTLSLTWPLGTGKFLMTPKQCSSVANQLGKKEILSEMYGVSAQGITFEDRKHIGDFLAILGINYRCFHGSFYSIRGRRKRIYVPHLSYQQPWWKDNKIIADYFARLSYALRRGQYRADVLILHPVESAFCIFDSTKIYDRVNEPTDIKALNDCMVSLSENLLKIHRGFDYGDESLMAKYGRVTVGGLSVGEMKYETVVLPSLITLRKTTVDLLRKFIESGGTVLSVGELPSRIDGKIDEGIKEFNGSVRRVKNDPYELKRALDGIVPPVIEIITVEGKNAEDVWVQARNLDKARLFFLSNTNSDQVMETEVRIRGSGKLEYWDLETGAVGTIPQHRDGGFTVTRLSFPPVASHLLLIKGGRKAADMPRREYGVGRTYYLSGGKRIKRHSPNAITLDFCRLRKGRGDWSDALPVIGVQQLLDRERYEGPITLEFRFKVETKPKKIFAVIEDATEYDVRINGKAVGYSGLPYYVDRSFNPVDISDQVQMGENMIHITRHFRPVLRPTFELGSLFESLPGVELESIYLIGDFAVKGKISSGEQRPKCVRYQPDFVLTEEAKVSEGDLIADGYPFFAGRVSFTTTLKLDPPGKNRIFIKMDHLNAVIAKINVNGKHAASIVWPPYELDITKCVKGGDNVIEIELTNSLRNLLGPHHRPAGEPTSTWETDYSGAWIEEERKSYQDWFKDRSKSTTWTDDYFFVPFGLDSKVKIEYLSMKS